MDMGSLKENPFTLSRGGGFGGARRTDMLSSRGRVNRSSVLSMMLCTCLCEVKVHPKEAGMAAKTCARTPRKDLCTKLLCMCREIFAVVV